MAYVPLGKFDCARDDLLYTLACSWDWAADHEGDVEGFGVYAWVMTVERDSLSDEQVAEVAEEAARLDPEDAKLPDSIYGHWIVGTDSQGFVYVTEFPDEEALDAHWELCQAQYAKWCDENQDEDGNPIV